MNSYGVTLCVLLGTLLLFSASRAQQPKEFEEGKEYYFDYLGYSLSGRSGAGHYTGFKLNASICLSVVKEIKGGLHMQLRFRRSQLEVVNGDISPFKPYALHSPRWLTSGPAFKKINADLKGVVHFNWKSGSVSDVMRPPKESEEVSNLRKGALGMFNIDLGRLANKVKNDALNWQYEEDVDGVCKTGYVVMGKEKDELTIARTRNLYDCTNSTAKVHRFLQGDTCSKEGSIHNTPMLGISNTRIKLNMKDSNKFFLQSVCKNTEYSLPVPNTPMPLINAYVAQELIFDKVGGKPETLTDKLEATSIQAVVSMSSMADEKKENPELRKLVDNYLAELKMDNNNMTFNINIKGLVNLLRRASVKDLKYALEKADGSGDVVKASVYDVFGNIGTKEAQEVVLAKVDDDKTSDLQAACLLRSLSFSTLNPAALEETLMKKADSERLQKKDRVKTLQTLWMMAGALHCRLERRNDQTMADWLKKQFESKHPNMDDDSKTTTLLMALGNAGALPSFEYLLKMLKDPTYNSPHYRLHIIHSLRKFSQQPALQSRIRMTLWMIFSNFNEDSELRITAFQGLMKTNPRRRHMSILMSQLRQDPCQHVRSFVMSYLKLIAWSGRLSPCRAKLSRLVRSTLPSLPSNLRKKPGMFQSRILFFPMMKSHGIYVSIIYCKHSPLPRSVTIGNIFSEGQTETNIWTMTIRSEESGILLRNIANPDGSIIERLQTLFKEFKGEKDNSKFAKSTVHFSLSGEDAGYFGTTFLGSKSNPLEALQMLLKVGSNNLAKVLYMDSGAHIPTSFGTTLNWFGSAVAAQQMSIKKKDIGMTFNFGHTGVAEMGVGFSYDIYCLHPLVRLYHTLMPGKTRYITMSMKLSKDMKKVSFEMHIMPHRYNMVAVQMGAQHLQVSHDSSTGKTNFTPIAQLENSNFYKTDMAPYFLELRGYRRIEDVSGVLTPFDITVRRPSMFCGMQIEFELMKPPKEAVPPRTNRRAPRKVKLIKDLKSGDTKNNPARYYQDDLFGIPSFAKAEVKMTMKAFAMMKGKTKDINLGTGEIKFSPSGDEFDLKFRPRRGEKIKLSYKRRMTGSLPYYDANNPFTITYKTGVDSSLTLKVGSKTMGSISRKSEISAYWIKEWQRLLENPAQVSETWPDIYHCYDDIQNGFVGSPCCYRAWRQLQTFDTVTYTFEAMDGACNLPSSVHKRIESSLSRFYTYSTSEKSMKKGLVTQKLTANFCPSDARTIARNQNYYSRILDGFPRRATCTLSFYEKERKFYVRTFDGLSYIGAIPGTTTSTKGKGFVLARDCSRNQFTVGIGTFKSGTRYVVIYTNDSKGSCKAIAYQKPTVRPKFLLKGKGCGNDESGKDGNIYFANMKSVGVKVLVTGSNQLTLEVDRLVYLNSLHGICGNFDSEPEQQELLGCDKKKAKYYDNNTSGRNAMVEDYMTASLSKYDECSCSNNTNV